MKASPSSADRRLIILASNYDACARLESTKREALRSSLAAVAAKLGASLIVGDFRSDALGIFNDVVRYLIGASSVPPHVNTDKDSLKPLVMIQDSLSEPGNFSADFMKSTFSVDTAAISGGDRVTEYHEKLIDSIIAKRLDHSVAI